MEIFWSTIADYNSATWPIQLILVVVAAILTLMLYSHPTPAVRVAMKLFMAVLNFWIAIAYYMIYAQPREYNLMLAIFWAVMGCIWIHDLVIRHESLERTDKHVAFAIILFIMPLVYPLVSLLLGRSFPMITSPVMPCSVAVFTIALMLAFSRKVNVVLAMCLCHWALIGLSKVYFYGIPEDFILACSVVPALYIFFRQYIKEAKTGVSKPSPKVLNALLIVLCIIIGTSFALTLLHQVNMFVNI